MLWLAKSMINFGRRFSPGGCMLIGLYPQDAQEKRRPNYMKANKFAKSVEIHHVGHRKDIYKLFKEAITK